MSQRMYKRNYADELYLAGWYPCMLNVARSIIFLFATAMSTALVSSGSTDSDNKNTDKTLKLVGRASSASPARFKPFEEG